MSIETGRRSDEFNCKNERKLRGKILRVRRGAVGYQYGITEGRKTTYINISFNGEICTSLEFFNSLYLKVTALEICGGTEQDWGEIEPMTLFQEERSYEFAPVQFGIFHKKQTFLMH